MGLRRNNDPLFWSLTSGHGPSRATIYTDGARVFTRLTDKGYTHHATPGYAAVDRDAVMPRPHLVSSLLKRWTADTLHYRLSAQHLPYDLDEFTFRVNPRTSNARGLLFYLLLQQAVDTDPTVADMPCTTSITTRWQPDLIRRWPAMSVPDGRPRADPTDECESPFH